jgi:osmotically-inducible protein OsmY
MGAGRSVAEMRRNRQIAIVVLAAVLVLASRAAAFAGERDDEAIRLNIESSLLYQRALAGERLVVTFAQGRASLSGTVRTLYQKWQALEGTARVRGVVSIDDRIALFGQPPRDATLAGDVRRRFEDLPKVASAGLRVTAHDGIVTLKGTVRDARTRFEARDAVAQLPGVVGVVDRIESPERPDERLQKDIQNLIGPRSLRRVPGEITVTVEGGIARFEGWVPRLWDRIEAERTALGINGVKGVSNQLEVRPRPRPDAYLE